MVLINQGFEPKRDRSANLPPGQYLVRDFPVLSLGPTPKIEIRDWKLEVVGEVENPAVFDWDQFQQLPQTKWSKDIHCVTKWSKLGTAWSGVLLDEIIERVIIKPAVTHVIFHSADGYSTNLPLDDVIEERAMIATRYEDEIIPAEHGGPVRMVIPHLYFWKSAKWLERIVFTDHDEPGFWETRGYHNYGDPWLEQRYTDD